MKEKIKKIIVASNIYDVLYEKDLGNYGVVYYNSQKINISPSIGDDDEYNNPCESSMMRTLFHEVLHIIFKIRFEYVKSVYKLSEKQEEHLIDEIANNFYEFLVSNPKVLGLLTEHSEELFLINKELNGE